MKIIDVTNITLTEELSLTDLLNSTKRIPTKKRHHSTDSIQVKIDAFVTYPSQKILTIKSNSGKYETMLEFSDVEYTDDKINTTNFTNTEGIAYNIIPISDRTSNVKVSCECKDYKWRFSKPNTKSEANIKSHLTGNEESKIKKNTKTGMCKHIIKMSSDLKKLKIIS